MLLLDFVRAKWKIKCDCSHYHFHPLHSLNLAIANLFNKKLENFFSFLVLPIRQLKDSNFHLNLYKILNLLQNLQLVTTKGALEEKFINFVLSQSEATIFFTHSKHTKGGGEFDLS
jgi:hypothetical protein